MLKLAPSDRALAARLLLEDRLPPDRLMAALQHAAASGRDLGQSLIELDMLAPADPILLGGATVVPDAPTLLEETHGGTERPIAPGPPPVGKGRYRFEQEIGRGGMGRVHRAVDEAIGRSVAVKTVLGAPPPEPLVRRFWLEVHAGGLLEHPSIIPLHDVGELPGGELFYVMKLLEGRTLAEILAGLARQDEETEAEYPFARLLTSFQQVAYAVAYAHSRRVLHRDIKPANIMIGDFGEATLIDWGLAKLVGNPDVPWPTSAPPASAIDTASGTIVGTPQYMSPEAADGDPSQITEASDVYGLGAVLFELLALTPAFPERSPLETLLMVRQAERIRPSERAPENRPVPRELEELCLAAMHPEPAQRPTAKGLADAIGVFLEGTKARARRRAEAKQRVDQGRAAVTRHEALSTDLERMRAEARRLEKALPPWAPIEEKRSLWAIEDRAAALEVEVTGAFALAEASFQGALADVPDDPAARSALAALYYARFVQAEAARDRSGQRYYGGQVARYDDGSWTPLLDARGTLEVRVQPPDAELRLARVEEADRVLVPGVWRPLREREVELPVGSYLLEATAPGRLRLLAPVELARAQTATADLELLFEGALPDTFVYVPGGPCLLGGDPVAHGALERRRRDVPGFAIARHPVTCGDYRRFLDTLHRRDPEAAARHVPRKDRDAPYWIETTDGYAYPSEGPEPWSDDLPVFGVSMEDALAYCAWWSGQSGVEHRLPEEDEWEKAARGVDGRYFPWGDRFDPTFCNMKTSRPAPAPAPVGTYARDVSPYGVHDLAGGVRELCVGPGGVPVMRGGCWHDTGLFCRVAFRHECSPDFVNSGLGFRLAFTPEEKSRP